MALGDAGLSRHNQDMSDKPVIDADFEVIMDPIPTEEELAERDASLAAFNAELDRTYLKGWRLILAMAITFVVLLAVYTTLGTVANYLVDLTFHRGSR